jgi:hypothetical protein
VLPPIGDLDVLASTRNAWHSVAEHVLAAARHRATGRIGLRVTPGGCGTPPYEREGATEEVRIAGRDLVARVGDATTTTPLTTVGAAAAVVGIEPGGPSEVYRLATPLDPDAPLLVDDSAARVLAGWFELAWAVLVHLHAEAGRDAAPSEVTLWPEHFDAAVELGDAARGTRGTFGASPGDAEHAEPYLYVTHWSDVPEDPCWNDTAFEGASFSYSQISLARDARDAMIDFYRYTRSRLNAAQR